MDQKQDVPKRETVQKCRHSQMFYIFYFTFFQTGEGGRYSLPQCFDLFSEISQLALPLSQHEDCNCFYMSLLCYHHLFIIQWMPGSQGQTGLTLQTSEPFLELFNDQLFSNMIYD